MERLCRLILIALLVFTSTAWARNNYNPMVATSTDSNSEAEPVPLDTFNAASTFAFESDLNHGGSFGEQYEAENRFEYAHRFLINGPWYFHLGLAYDRFDFGNTSAPVPVHLQSGAAVIGFEYMKGADTGAFLLFRPGFYTEEHLGIASFDCPILAGRFWTLQEDKLYVLAGVYAAFLKGGYPIIPIAGIVWKPNDQFKFMLIPPNPRIIYNVSKQFEVFIGGELAGGAFRTDHHDDYVGPHVAKLSGTQVDFADYRAGGGFTYVLTNSISIDGNAGCSIERAFLYHRAGENYRTNPSPYIQVALKAAF